MKAEDLWIFWNYTDSYQWIKRKKRWGLFSLFWKSIFSKVSRLTRAQARVWEFTTRPGYWIYNKVMDLVEWFKFVISTSSCDQLQSTKVLSRKSNHQFMYIESWKSLLLQLYIRTANKIAKGQIKATSWLYHFQIG